LREILFDLREGRARTEWTHTATSEEVISTLKTQGLLCLWFSLVPEHERTQLSPALLSRLNEERLFACARWEKQEQGLRTTGGALDAACIPWTTLKGAALCTSLYEYPHHRPMVDLDILVLPQDFERAQLVLAEVAQPRSHGQRSHEQNLQAQGYWIDLHRDLVGTGRSRLPLGSLLVERRRRHLDKWIPDSVGTFLSLTVHLALTDYVTSRLIRLVDLDRWLRLGDINWNVCVSTAKEAGLAHAAWLSLHCCRKIFESPVPASVMQALGPGTMKGAYLRAWLNLDPAQLYQRHPTVSRAGFQFFLGDSLRDNLRALRALRSEMSGMNAQR
jgi:hypothetical protein